MSIKGIYRIGVSSSEISNVLGINFSENDLEKSLRKSGLLYHVVSPREQILISVKSVLGKPYKRGASVLKDAPDFFDCSSFVAWTAVEAGFAIPRISVDQYVYAQKLKKQDLQPGDLIFFNTGVVSSTQGTYFSQVLGREVKEEPIRTETLEYKPGTKVPQGVDHVGIYIGDGKIIHASKGRGGVVEETLNPAVSWQHIVGYGRIVSDEQRRFIIEIPPEQKDLRNKENLLNHLSLLGK